MNDKPSKKIIGRVERVDFPAFGLRGLEAKIDTGAYTSSIHCADVRVESVEGSTVRSISFTLLDPEHPDYNGKRFIAKYVDVRKIRSSNGEQQERYVVETQLNIAGEEVNTLFSLADRESMNYPVLIGSRALKG